MSNKENIIRMRKHLQFITRNYTNRDRLTGNRRLLYDACERLQNRLHRAFSIDEIEKEIGKNNFCNNNQPQDYCYNSVNIACLIPKFLLKRDRGMFEFKEIAWKPNNEEIVNWTPKCCNEIIKVGTYNKNGFSWVAEYQF